MFLKEEWYPAIAKRVSRRSFNSEAIPEEVLAKLDRMCFEFRFPEARACLVTEQPQAVFKGVLGSYGKIKGAQAYLAFIGDIGYLHHQEKVGYLGEGFILEATALGLATCWVGGFFRPDVVARQIYLDPGEKVLAVTPIGYSGQEYSFQEKLLSGLAKSKNRKDLADLTQGIPMAEWPQWLRLAIEAARLAPSAVNRQPWRFRVEHHQITVLVDSLEDSYHIAKRLDCGIAMLHIQLAARAAGINGQWEYLTGSEVAVFNVQGE